MTEKYLYCLLGLAGGVTVLLLIITGLQEVNERRYETGILIAQGAGYTYIMGLYLFKTAVLAVVAASVGFLAGGSAAVALTSPFLATQTREVSMVWSYLPLTCAAFVAVAVLAEFIPMLKLVRMDPCAILMEE